MSARTGRTRAIADARSHARALSATLGAANIRANANANARASHIEPDTAIAIETAYSRAIRVVAVLGADCDLTCVSDLLDARAHAHALDDVLALIRVEDRAIDRDLNNAHNFAMAIIGDLAFAHDLVVSRVYGRAQREARRVAPSAARLLVAAIRLLPAADRRRHAEEYRSELWDLAQAGAGRLGQLGYALRQVRSAPRTGLALRSPRRRSVTP